MHFLIITTTLLLTTVATTLAMPQRISDEMNQCTAAVSPGRASGYGAHSCQPVAAADCINGGTASNTTVCAYSGRDCGGLSTALDGSSPRGNAGILRDGALFDINSFRVVVDGGC